MSSQELNQNSGLKEAIDKVNIALRIRGIAFVFFLLAILIFELLHFLHYSLHIWLTISAIITWAISAFLFRALVKKQKNPATINALSFAYSALLEFGFLTIIVFTNAGILWIGAIFYIFIIICSNIALPKKRGHLISLVAFLWFGGGAILQYLKIIPFLSCFMFSEIPANYLTSEYLIVTLVFAFIAFFLSGFSANTLTGILKKRTEELEKTESQLEETRAVLEIRVRARTRELKELADGLEEQVEERTKELEERIRDLKRFQNLSVDRELKMIELKKELKK